MYGCRSYLTGPRGAVAARRFRNGSPRGGSRGQRAGALGFLLVLGVACLVGTAAADHTPDPASVTVAGNFQSELGCPGDWEPWCSTTDLYFDAEDQVWQERFDLPAGSWEYKAALDGSWDENYGANGEQNGANIPLDLSDPAAVKFYYDHKTHWITSNFNSVIVTAPGDFQSEIGCGGDWDPGCLRSWLQDVDGDGVYTWSSDAIPPGNYEVKIAIDESWDENYGLGGVPGGANIPFSVGEGAVVEFSYDHGTHILVIVVNEPVPVLERSWGEIKSMYNEAIR